MVGYREFALRDFAMNRHHELLFLPLLVAAMTLALPLNQVASADGPTAVKDPDTDGDGLSDFHELHKYRTDPSKKDSAGKGAPDDDQEQRREFTYSVRALIRVMPPYNLAALSDDYQDVRVVAETKEYAELEVVIYPLNTNADAISANPNWQTDDSGMSEYVAPGVTTNWDTPMQDRLLAELRGSGIDPQKLTDKEVVERVSRWMYSRAKHRNMFCTYFVSFPGGKASIFPGLEQAFEREKGSSEWSAAEQFSSELFGKEMFDRKVYGTCTSAAVAQATVLRAMGIPSRLIIAIPVVDASDDQQLAMAGKGLTHHQVRSTTMTGLAAAGKSFTAHTFLEVFVGNRWRRLNYSALGQNVLDPTYLGLMIHVHTFNDLSEARLAATWGARYALGKREGEFTHSNPYKSIALSDHFGRYAKLPNPPAEDREHSHITIDRMYWPDATDAPAQARAMRSSAAKGGSRFFVHGAEWFQNAGDYLQYKRFMQRADKNFVLSAIGRPEIRCRVSMSFVTDSSANVRDLELIIPPEDYAKMSRGVSYTLRPLNAVPTYQWRVKEGVTLTLEASAEEKLNAVLERLDRLEKRIEELEKKK
jgi:Transglutaminase-like superfamily